METTHLGIGYVELGIKKKKDKSNNYNSYSSTVACRATCVVVDVDAVVVFVVVVCGGVVDVLAGWKFLIVRSFQIGEWDDPRHHL